MKKHFLCTHTWTSDEAKEQFSVATKDMTDRQLLEGFKTEKAALSNQAKIKVVDPKPIDLGCGRIKYHEMTAAEYVSNKAMFTD